MAKGDPLTSPYYWASGDYLNRQISFSVEFDETTRDILSVLIHRDPDCLWTRIIWDDPSNNQKAKYSPTVPEGDTTLTAQQVRQATGFRTIEDMLAVQITAGP